LAGQEVAGIFTTEKYINILSNIKKILKMAIQKETYYGKPTTADPAGDTLKLTRIAEFIIIDTVVGGISGDGGTSNMIDLSDLLAKTIRPVTHMDTDIKEDATAALALEDDAKVYLEIAKKQNVRLIKQLPAGVTLLDSFNTWANAQIGVSDDEIFYVTYLGLPKIKNNKQFPYVGYKLTEETDLVYISIDQVTGTISLYRN